MLFTVRKINSHLLFSAIIVLVTVGIYWNALQGDFIWDDRGLIIGNANYLSDWNNIFAAFVNPLFGDIPYYRPLITAWFITDYHLWGANPFGFHYTNLIVHTANALLVYLFIVLLFKEATLAFFTSLLFTAHPVQSESVAWISGRNDMLLTLFVLISTILYLQRNRLKGVKGVFAYSGYHVSYACALLTKENGVVLPLLFMLIDYFFPERGKSTAKDYYGLLLVTVLYFIARGIFIGQIGLEVSERDFVHTIYNVIGSYAYYFKMLLLPLFQSAAPVIKSSSFSISSFSLVLCLSALAVLCHKRFKELSFAILWVTISLLPVCGIIPLSIPAQEHRLYLGTVCFSMLLPLGVYKLSSHNFQGKLIRKAIAIVPLIIPALLILYSAKTISRNAIWQDEHFFWIQTVHDSPRSSVARNNLGIVYARAGKHQMAIREFKKALALPENEGLIIGRYSDLQRGKLLNNLGQSYYQLLQKRLPGEEHVSTAVAADDTDSEEIEHETQRLFTLSRTCYQRALRINPASAEVHNNLGDLFYVMKSYPAAEEEYKKALEINPDNAVYYNNLGLVYYGLQSFSGAVKMLTEAISLQPDFLEARNNLALVYMHLGLYPQALEELERALSSGPDNPEFYFNLAMVYLRGFNDSESAVFYLKKGLKLTSRNSPDDMIKAGLKNLERDIAIENLSYLSADCRGQL